MYSTGVFEYRGNTVLACGNTVLFCCGVFSWQVTVFLKRALLVLELYFNISSSFVYFCRLALLCLLEYLC